MKPVTWDGFGEFVLRLDRAAALDLQDLAPLLTTWERVLAEDHRRGVLAGLDKDGVPMPRLRYRSGAGRFTKARRGRAYGKTVGRFAGFGPFQTGLHNNLTAGEYRQLGGPRLAPRGDDSRILTNFFTDHGRTGPDTFEANSFCQDVVGFNGEPFLEAHFNGRATGRGGKTKLPRYDLRGLRPWGVAEATQALSNFSAALFDPGA